METVGDILDRMDAEVLVEKAERGMYDAAGAMLADPAAEELLIGYLLNRPGDIGLLVDDLEGEEFRGEVDPSSFSEIFCSRMFDAMANAWRKTEPLTMEDKCHALGGDWGGKYTDGETIGQYHARLMADADLSIDPIELARHIQECAERRAIGEADDIRSLEPFVSKYGLTMWADQNDPSEEYDYLIEDLIPEKEGVVLMGESQTGKSFLTFHMAMCGARGKPFFGRRVLQPFGTIWCAYEASRGQKARMRAYRKFHGLELDHLPFGVLTKPLNLWPIEKQVDSLVEEMLEIERTQFNGTPLKMVVFDTYNAATPGASEIDSEVVSKIRLQFDRFREMMDVSTIIVGHTNNVGKLRGNEQLSNNIETVLVVSRKTKTVDRKPVEIRDDEGRVVRVMKVKKQREGLDGEETEFVLNVVEDGTKNKFGRVRTSCVVSTPLIVDPDDADPYASADEQAQVGVKATRQERLFLDCLIEALAESGVEPPAELRLPRSIGRVVDYDVVKRLMAQKMLREDNNDEEGKKRHRERVKAANNRARMRFLEIRVVGCHSPYIWLTGKAVRGVEATQPKGRDLFTGPDQGPPDDDLAGLY